MLPVGNEGRIIRLKLQRQRCCTRFWTYYKTGLRQTVSALAVEISVTDSVKCEVHSKARMHDEVQNKQSTVYNALDSAI